MSAPTPGPWAVDPISDDHDGPIDVVGGLTVGADGRKIANWIAQCDLQDDAAENRANARLIAAAPDLLDALRDLLAMITTDDLVPSSVSYMQQARAAIAKAVGR